MSTELELSDKTLIFPSGRPTEKPVVLDMTAISVAESREEEIKFVTQEKAHELLVMFIRAYRLITNYQSKARLQLERAELTLDRVGAELLIDRIPNMVKEKGLANSKDIRDALIVLDDGYMAAKERVSALKAVIKLLEGKAKALDMSYDAVAKIFYGRERRTPIYGGLDEKLETGQVEEDKEASPSFRIGKAKY
jgi:hypothetical protein